MEHSIARPVEEARSCGARRCRFERLRHGVSCVRYGAGRSPDIGSQFVEGAGVAADASGSPRRLLDGGVHEPQALGYGVDGREVHERRRNRLRHGAPCWRRATKAFSAPLPIRSRAIDSGNRRGCASAALHHWMPRSMASSSDRHSGAVPPVRIELPAQRRDAAGIRPSDALRSAIADRPGSRRCAIARITADARIASRIACAVPSPQIGSKAIAAVPQASQPGPHSGEAIRA